MALKPMLTIHIGPKPKGMPDTEDAKDAASGDPEEASSDEETAASEVLDAIKSKDAGALAEALKAFVKMC